MKHSETDLRTRKLIAIVVAVSNNPPDARAKKDENCQGERPPSRVLGILRQIGEHRYTEIVINTLSSLPSRWKRSTLLRPEGGRFRSDWSPRWATQTCESLRK